MFAIKQFPKQSSKEFVSNIESGMRELNLNRKLF